VEPVPDGRLEGRTAIPVLRSSGPLGRGADARDTRVGRAMASPRRRTATSGSTWPRPARPSHDTQTIASPVATAGGTSHQRISTRSG
jgi:hypothetical protein